MARTPLFSALQRLARLAVSADQLQLPERVEPGEICDEITRRIASRRRVLRYSLSAAGAALTSGLLLPGCGPKPTDNARGSGQGSGTGRGPDARVVIVGAGMAGTHCCYHLQKSGIRGHLYEAGGRVGGRIFSDRKTFAGQNHVCELGGELINTDHTTIRNLAAELDVELDDLHTETDRRKLKTDAFHIGGRMLEEGELLDMFRPLAAQMAKDMQAAEADPARLAALDQMSVEEWLDTHQAPATFRTLVDMAYTPEFGLEIGEQTCINLLEMLDWANPEPFRLLGNSDERFHTRGGNDTILTRMETRIDAARIHTRHALVKLAQSSNGTFKLTFYSASGTSEVSADVVVLALPYTKLREVELTLALPAGKRQAIDEIGYGTNAKLMSGFSSRVWAEQHGYVGASSTDVGNGRLQVIWDTAHGQTGDAGLITNFTGGKNGILLGDGTAQEQAKRIAPLIDQVFAGSAAAATLSAVRMHWPTVPHNMGSYACYKPGQITAFYDDVAAGVGKLIFCGEHTSENFQGYMEGACESGLRAARDVLELVKAA